ncbi:MAG: MauE/DoxX family redox-associated membrane protein [candidate division WOR-3 bacterium]
MNGIKRVIPLNRFFNKKTILFLIEVILGVLFIYSGYTKLINIFEFSLTVAKYGILPLKIINLFSLTLPFIEIFSGFFLISGFLREGAYFSLIFLIFIFTLAIIYVIIKGKVFECGCFEIFGGEPKTGFISLLRNLIILLFLLLGFNLRKRLKICYH